jgi:hypothetical protein
MNQERRAGGVAISADEVPASGMFDAAWRFVRASGKLIAADLAAEGCGSIQHFSAEPLAGRIEPFLKERGLR